MLQNAYFLAKIGADTAENEQHFAEILPKTGNQLAPQLDALRHGGARLGLVPRADREHDGEPPERRGCAPLRQPGRSSPLVLEMQNLLS